MPELAGEEATSQRAVGHRAESQLANRGENVVLWISGPERELGLLRPDSKLPDAQMRSETRPPSAVEVLTERCPRGDRLKLEQAGLGFGGEQDRVVDPALPKRPEFGKFKLEGGQVTADDHQPLMGGLKLGHRQERESVARGIDPQPRRERHGRF